MEEKFQFTVTDEKIVERVIQDENIHYIHMVFGSGEGFPAHDTNATVYMTVLRGTLSIELGGAAREFDRGTVLKIPQNTRMKADNLHDEVLELIVVKAPAPRAV